MQERICQTHFEPIVLLGDNNQDQCKACLEDECLDKILKLEKVSIKYKNTLNQSTDNHQIFKIQNLLDYISIYKLDLPESFNQRRVQYKQLLQQVNIVEDYKYKKFNYKLINEYPDLGKCFSFTFNQDSTQLFIGQQDLQVYEFKNGEIKNQLQTLKQHTDLIICLIYLNKSNELVSASNDSTIVIWNQDNNGSWKLDQLLKDHELEIYCLIKSKDEDLLISASKEKTIKLWKKTNMKWSCQQTIQTEIYVFSLSLSQSLTKLILCGWYQKEIVVMEQQQDQEWIISQTINTDAYGQHILFISDDRFAYSGEKNQVQIFLYDQQKKQFIQDKQINVQYKKQSNSFPCKYIESKNIFIINNNKFLNCFGIDQQQNLILQESIEYYNWFYGNVSNDGQYIVIYDYNQDKIEVRELQYIE